MTGYKLFVSLVVVILCHWTTANADQEDYVTDDLSYNEPVLILTTLQSPPFNSHTTHISTYRTTRSTTAPTTLIRVSSATTPPSCGRVPKVQNGVLDSHNFRYKTLRCDDGYVLDGNGSISCNDQGIWTRPGRCVLDPTPRVMGCGNPPNVTNGRFSSTNSPRQRRLLCDDGYVVVGSSGIRCENDEWSTPGNCTEESSARTGCEVPRIENGNVLVETKSRHRDRRPEGSQVEPQEIIIIRCSQGFRPAGGSRRSVCLRNGHFDRRPSKCLRKPTTASASTTRSNSRCGRLPELTNGNFSEGGSDHEDFRYVQCAPGYSPLNGSEIIVCNFGKWTDDYSRCEPVNVRCGSLPELANGNFSQGGSDHEDFRYVQCAPGYSPSNGSEIIVCDSGKWLDDYSRCEPSEVTTSPYQTTTPPLPDFAAYEKHMGTRCQQNATDLGLRMPNLTHCHVLCENNASCIGFTYSVSTRNCSIQYSNCTQTNHAESVFFEKRNWKAPILSSMPKLDSSSPTGSENFRIIYNRDCAGGNAALHTSGEACRKACYTDTTCLGIRYKPDHCLAYSSCKEIENEQTTFLWKLSERTTNNGSEVVCDISLVAAENAALERLRSSHWRLQCQQGYFGSTVLVCNETTGHWSSLGKCYRHTIWTQAVPSNCTEMPVTVNGFFKKSQAPFYSHLMCNEGYYPKGNTVARCELSGVWSISARCSPLESTLPSQSPNGHINAKKHLQEWLAVAGYSATWSNACRTSHLQRGRDQVVSTFTDCMAECSRDKNCVGINVKFRQQLFCQAVRKGCSMERDDNTYFVRKVAHYRLAINVPADVLFWGNPPQMPGYEMKQFRKCRALSPLGGLPILTLQQCFNGCRYACGGVNYDIKLGHCEVPSNRCREGYDESFVFYKKINTALP